MSHTKGKFKIKTSALKTEFWVDGDIEDTFSVLHNEKVIREVDGNDLIILDAFNVTNETGLTPRELLAQRDELVEALKKLLSSHRTLSFNSNFCLSDMPVESEAQTLLNKINQKP